MTDTIGPASPWRWVVLGAFMLVNFVIQVLWICYAPISAEAARLYGVSELSIGFFAMLFMIAYVPLSVPVAWLIDRFGFRNMVILGSAIMTISAFARGLAGSSYALALAGTIGLSVSQPFFLNAWTKMPAHWHPEGERATAVGLITLSNLVGIAVGMALTPQLVKTLPIPAIQFVYALAALASGIVFALVAREYPKVRIGPMGKGEKALMIEGLKEALANPSFRLLCIVAFVVLGLFNGVNTWIEAIVSSRGFSAADAGDIGAIILLGGIIGAVALPALSDRSGLRLPWLMVGIIGAIPSILGLAFFPSHLLVMVSAFFLGFFLTSILPVGMQYSTEVTRPVPEGTTGGLIQLAGQASVVFVFLMDVVRGPSRSFGPALVLSAILLALSAVLVGFMKEAPKTRSQAANPVLKD